MTAEIAIINRSSVTLAADSAMTMTVGGRRKVYTSTDKIFELSEKDPIGIMIYNNLEFMGAPLEVVIKQFRKSSHCADLRKMPCAAERFFSFLESDWPSTQDQQKQHAADLLQAVYRKIWNALWEQTGFDFGSEKVSSRKPLDVLLDLVALEVMKFEALPVSTRLQDIREDDIVNFYKAVLDNLITKMLGNPPLGKPQRALCRRLGAMALHRDNYSDTMTGLVFAGFGRDEIFPSILHYETDGIVMGRLKWRLAEHVETNAGVISARVVPFAQRDVVDRFLTGIDPSMHDGIKDYLNVMEQKTREALFHGVGRISEVTKQRLLNNLDASLGGMTRDFDSWLRENKKAYSRETEDMILFMPKPEAAHLAESLVNITSLKRKYSAGEETVAGPIDVAVISRSDGLVWVRRKHYFSPELNPRYFVRKFGLHVQRQQTGDDHHAEGR